MPEGADQQTVPRVYRGTVQRVSGLDDLRRLGQTLAQGRTRTKARASDAEGMVLGLRSPRSISSPKPQAPSPKPQAPSPKPQAPSPKPQAPSPNPKPSPKPKAPTQPKPLSWLTFLALALTAAPAGNRGPRGAALHRCPRPGLGFAAAGRLSLSKVAGIFGARLDGTTCEVPGNADTWYPSWAADGNLYSPWTDGYLLEGGGGREQVPFNAAHPAYACNSADFLGRKAATGQAKLIGSHPLELKVVNIAPRMRGQPRNSPTAAATPAAVSSTMAFGTMELMP